MSSPIARVVAELKAALAEIEEAQIALDNAQAKAALALRGFAAVTEGSNHDLTKVARASWAGAANRFDRARRVLEASAHAIAAYQHEIAPGLAGDSRTVLPPPAGDQLPAERARGRKASDRFLDVLAREAGDVGDVTKGVTDTTESVRQTYHTLPPPPTATQAGTGAPPQPEIVPAQQYAPTIGDIASGIVLGAIAGIIGFREMRRQRKELKAEDEQAD